MYKPQTLSRRLSPLSKLGFAVAFLFASACQQEKGIEPLVKEPVTQESASTGNTEEVIYPIIDSVTVIPGTKTIRVKFRSIPNCSFTQIHYQMYYKGMPGPIWNNTGSCGPTRDVPIQEGGFTYRITLTAYSKEHPYPNGLKSVNYKDVYVW